MEQFCWLIIQLMRTLRSTHDKQYKIIIYIYIFCFLWKKRRRRICVFRFSNVLSFSLLNWKALSVEKSKCHLLLFSDNKSIFPQSAQLSFWREKQEKKRREREWNLTSVSPKSKWGRKERTMLWNLTYIYTCKTNTFFYINSSTALLCLSPLSLSVSL